MDGVLSSETWTEPVARVGEVETKMEKKTTRWDERSACEMGSQTR